MSSSHSWFPNARNFEVKDSQINTIANANVTINHNTTNNDSVTTILWPHVAAGAIFNSAERYAAGKCHPGTRKKIIERIVAWIEDPDPSHPVLWIYGAAGAGKSAIAHSICELLKDSHPDDDGGSFFFASGSPDCGNALKLFRTLSYQLAIQFPCIRGEINNALSRDPSLPTKSTEIQLLTLIVQPLLRCQAQLPRSPILIIDGLDECANDTGKGTTQGDIIALISKCVVEHKIPLRFMVFSRPEYWIRDAFDTAPLPDITLSLSLRDDVDADKDIRAYLTEEFERIRAENKRFMRSVVPPWPPTKIVDRFVEEASGQYVYAATVLKFVGNDSKFSNPQKQLEIITSAGPHRALAYSDLDKLYAAVLSAYPEWKTMKRVLAALLLEANATIITVVLGVDSDELVLVLDALSSLIDIKKRKSLSEDLMFLDSIFDSLQDGLDLISFSHLSFREFLQDESRSGPFYIDLDSDPVPREIVNGYFDMVHRNLDQNYEIAPHIFLDIDLATYHAIMPHTTFLSTLHCTDTSILPLITHSTAKLDLFDFGRLTHMHSVFYFAHALINSQHTLREQLIYADHNLGQAMDLACKRALSALASCTNFKATPTLVYLTEYGSFHSPVTLPGCLHTIAGLADSDVISALREHHYILPLEYNIIQETWTTGSFLCLGSYNAGQDWRTQGAWRDLRIVLVHKALKSILMDIKIHSQPVWESGLSQQTAVTTLTEFFNSRNVSDIDNNEHSRKAPNLVLLSVMTDLEVWLALSDKDWDSLPFSFPVSILCWINRQWTNTQTVKLLQNYDQPHQRQQKIVTAMERIFEHGLLKNFIKQYETGLCALAFHFRTGFRYRSRSIKLWPLPKGLVYEEGMDFTLRDKYRRQDHDWQSFHDELFGKTGGSIEASPEPIIPPSQWHPHLVIALLKMLVQFLYGRIYPEFSADFYEESLPYITECLPYAHPTQENLDALRAVVYLYPRAIPAWNPPEGFWSLVLGFLQKYDRSILSSEELRLFVLWLNSSDHADIKTYLDQ